MNGTSVVPISPFCMAMDENSEAFVVGF